MHLEFFDKSRASALLQHSQAVGWYDASDWACYFETGRVLGHVSETGHILSSAYYSNFQDRLGWLGACIVVPQLRGQGLGRALMESILGSLPPAPFVFGLVSTPEGVPLYRRFGFVEMTHTHKFITEKGFSFPAFSCPAGFQIRALTPADNEKVHSLDTQAVGAPRRPLIDNRLLSAKLGVVAENAHGEIVGSLLGCFANGRLIMGPLLSPTDALALAMISAMGCQWTECTRIDVLETHRPVINEVARWGMKLERVSPVMTLNGLALPFDSKLYCGLTTQGLG